GSATITVDPLPTIFAVTGGGAYCTGGTGVAIGLSDSETGISYSLQRGGTDVGTPVAGTGVALSFGLQTVAGTYTVVATNTTSLCTAPMSGSATITVDPSPTVFAMTGGGAYCTGGTGVAIGLADSDTGVSYYLQRSGVDVG